MFGKVAIAGATAAVILGAGTAALAVSGDSSNTSGSATSSSSSSSTGSSHGDGLGRFARRHPGLAAALAHHGVHGQIVTTNGKGDYTTHDGIVGSVTAVSSTAITVKSSDNFVQTYVVNSTTKVRVKPNGKSSTIGQVKVGDNVAVLGTGTTSPVATYVLDKA